MMGADDSLFANPDLSALDKLAIAINLPKTINQMAPLPSGTAERTALVTKFRTVSEQAHAARQLGMMGYKNLDAFKGMSALQGKETRASDALALVKTTPQPFDLPRPIPPASAKENFSRLFSPSNAGKIRSYGTPNPVSKVVLAPQTQNRIIKTPLPVTRTVTAAEVLAFNQIYWRRN